MPPSFTDRLREDHRQTWESAVGHRFVTELADGTVDDAVMAGYLVQDHRFLDGFLVLLGAAVAAADGLAPRLPLARFIGVVAGEENTYFLRAFDALGVSEQQRREVPDTAPTAAFTALFREAAATGQYAAMLAVLVVTEWLYHDWASRAAGRRPPSFVHAEWIDLHDGPAFAGFVAFLRAELDRVGPAHREIAQDFFGRAVAIELAFFDAAYEHPLTPDGAQR